MLTHSEARKVDMNGTAATELEQRIGQATWDAIPTTCLLFVAVWTLVLICQPASGQLHEERLTEAFNLVRDAVENNEVPGAIALVAQRGRIVRHEALGLSDLERQTPFRTNTLCWMASITKPVTVAAAMTLVDQGSISLDDPVEKYLPEFRQQQDQHGEHHAFTIRHLMTHTSGLVGNPPTRKSVDVIGGALTDAWLSQKLPDIVSAIASSQLRFQPGAKVQYSNAALFVLGRVIEVVSGKPYAAYVKEKILDPLGMLDSYYAPPPPEAWRVSPIYAEKQGKRTAIFRFNPELRITNTAPDGGLFSYPRELAKFLQMFLDNDGKVLSQQSVQAMLSEQAPGWGLGWALEEGLFTHGGSSGTVAWGDPKTSTVGILFLQFRDDKDKGAELRRSFQKAVREALTSDRR